MALRIATEVVEAFSYKLTTLGVYLEGPAEVYCDKKSVVINSSVPVSVLDKRHNAIWYHRVREAQAERALRVGWIPGENNLSDLLKNTTMKVNMRHELL